MTTVDFFYILCVLMMFSGLAGFRTQSCERLFSMYLLQILLAAPLLSGIYVYASFHLKPELMPLVLFSETVYAFLSVCCAYWLNRAVVDETAEIRRNPWIGIGARLAVIGAGLYGRFRVPLPEQIEDSIFIPHYGIYFFAACFLLLAAAGMAWRLEYFWRSLSSAQRWAYKYFLVGAYLVCGALAWFSSYRLSYLRHTEEQFMLAGIVVAFGWLFMAYATARHRLLNRKIFVSRKIVYTFVAPLAFGFYLIGLGMLIVVMRYLDQPMSYVLQWLLFVAGLATAAVLVLSSSVRRRVKFFISTHFYVNKYEYRDEWLDFSRMLQGALNEAEIVGALEKVMGKSLYTDILCVWVGDEEQGYRPALIKGFAESEIGGREIRFSPDDALVRHLQKHDHYHAGEKDGLRRSPECEWEDHCDAISRLGLTLFSPMISGERLVGFIGLGPEITGGRYSQDDYDLLLALGSQAASALQAGRMAEELSRVRQREAWNTMSSFVMHDVKNAASMLSLVRQNAKGRMDNPEFQVDLLEAIDDALKRMGKVQNLLGTLKGEKKPELEKIEICALLEKLKTHSSRKLPGLNLAIQCNGPVNMKTDPEMLSRIMENLFLNALEAGGPGTSAVVSYREKNDIVFIDVSDDGPGLPPDLSPEAIFEAFKTTKPNGSGIGLWHVKRLATILGGSIAAANSESCGAVFSISLPKGKALRGA